MERLKQIFNSDFDINKLSLTEKQADTILTVWAEHFGKEKPTRTCKEQLRSYARQLQGEYANYLKKGTGVNAKLVKIAEDKNKELLEEIEALKKENAKLKSNKKKRK